MQTRYSKLNLFSADGRIGRSTYIAFSIIIPLLIFWVLASVSGLISQLGDFGESIGYALLLITIVLAAGALLLLTIQRSHDFNTKGWLALLVLLLPPMLILFWLMPGTNGINRYGEPPAKLINWFKWLTLGLAAILIAMTAFLASMY